MEEITLKGTRWLRGNQKGLAWFLKADKGLKKKNMCGSNLTLWEQELSRN